MRSVHSVAERPAPADGPLVRGLPALPIVLTIGALTIGLLAASRGRSLVEVALTAAFGSVFVALAWFDLERRSIPNRIVYPALVMALVVSAAWPDREVLDGLSGGAIAFTALGTVAVLSRGGVGAGDIKMGTLVGLVVGYPSVLAAGTIMALTGGLAAIALLAAGAGGRTYLVYGPFIAAGASIGLLR